MTRHAMVRTYKEDDPSPTNALQRNLDKGWKVIFATRGNGYIEYILEKEFEEEGREK